MGKEDAVLNERLRGVIIPPPETKKLIDKAAELVAKYGSSVEANLKNDEKNLPKFSFFNHDDPYRAYFDQKVNDLVKRGMSGESKSLNMNFSNEEKFLGKKMESSNKISLNSFNSFNSSIRNPSSIQNELRMIIEAKRLETVILSELKPPSADQYSISHPNINSLEMDIIKATAQFVARNGQRFLTGLSERETKNPQYDFLKPQHTLFGYFTYLVESYARCLRKEDTAKLNQYSNREAVLKKATERYLWEKRSKDNQKKKDNLDEQERTQMAIIDWQEFAIVEVIDFTEEELYNTVTILQGRSNETINSIDANVNAMIKNNNNIISEITEFITEPITRRPPSPDRKEIFITPITPVIIPIANVTIPIANVIKAEIESLPEPGMKIIKNYVRKTESSSGVKKDTVKCPLCKEFVTIDEWPHHIKVELLDPKWKEIQKELQERKTEVNLAPTNDFLGYLGDFSKYRPDLFGEANDIVKVEEKRKIEAKVSSTIWDGYAPNMTRTTANIAMLAQQTKKNYEESKKSDGGNTLNSTQGEEKEEFTSNTAFRGLTSNRYPNTNSIPISVTRQTALVNTGNGNSTLTGTGNNDKINEQTKLVPEEVFLQKNPKPFKLNIKVPKSDTHPKLKGQIITIVINPQDSLSNVKSQIINTLDLPYDQIINSSIVKSFDGDVLNETNSAAYYNLSQGKTIEFILF